MTTELTGGNRAGSPPCWDQKRIRSLGYWVHDGDQTCLRVGVRTGCSSVCPAPPTIPDGTQDWDRTPRSQIRRFVGISPMHFRIGSSTSSTCQYHQAGKRDKVFRDGSRNPRWDDPPEWGQSQIRSHHVSWAWDPDLDLAASQ